MEWEERIKKEANGHVGGAYDRVMRGGDRESPQQHVMKRTQRVRMWVMGVSRQHKRKAGGETPE